MRKKKKQTPAAKPRSVTEVDAIIGERIRTARMVQGISQSELARELGLTFQQIQKYEKGVNRVSGARMLALAQALNMNVTDFYDQVNVKRSDDARAFDKFLTTVEGVQIIEAMMQLPKAVRKSVIALAQTLAASEEQQA